MKYICASSTHVQCSSIIPIESKLMQAIPSDKKKEITKLMFVKIKRAISLEIERNANTISNVLKLVIYRGESTSNTI